jgi:hypothetical protein
MVPSLRGRFWVEMFLAASSTGLFAVTLVWREWIEIVFKVDPDHGNGTLEWTIVAAAFVFALIFWIGAGREWRRAALLPRAGEGAS